MGGGGPGGPWSSWWESAWKTAGNDRLLFSKPYIRHWPVDSIMVHALTYISRGKFSSLTLPLKYWACRCSTCLDVGRSDGSEGLTKESNFFSLWSKYGNSVSVWIILWPRYFTSPNTYPYPSSDTLHDNENQCLNWNQHKKILSDSSDTFHTIMIKTCHRFSPCMLWLLVKVFWTIGLMYLRHF